MRGQGTLYAVSDGSPATGGDIGWVERSQIEDEIMQVLDQTPPNRATPPIRTASGFYVYLLRDKRVLAAPSLEDATVTLAQLVLPLEPDAAPADIAAQKDLAETVRDTISGCDDLKRVADELGVTAGDPTPNLRVGHLNPALRPLVAELKVGDAAKPLQTESGIVIVMGCEREEPPSNVPSREDIADNLTRQRLDLVARRHLRDLRRAAFIDVRV